MFENVYEGNAALNTCEMCCTFQVSVATEIADCNWLRIPANFVACFDHGIPGGRGHKFFSCSISRKIFRVPASIACVWHIDTGVFFVGEMHTLFLSLIMDASKNAIKCFVKGRIFWLSSEEGPSICCKKIIAHALLFHLTEKCFF